MKRKLRWIFLGIALVSIWLGLAFFCPMQLLHSAELKADVFRPSIQRYFDVIGTVAGWQDLNIMAQVATGQRLKDMIQYRCISCSSIEVDTKNYIANIEVLDNADTTARVRVRVEHGWHEVNPYIGQLIGPCHAQAATTILILEKQGDMWKVSDIGDIDAADVDSVGDTPELRAKYCSNN
ncbi:MAG: hypothetical protein WCF84_12505 [Anaerolineae bacterium]